MQTFNHIIANFAVTALVSLLWTVLKHNNVCQLHFTNQHSAACHIHMYLSSKQTPRETRLKVLPTPAAIASMGNAYHNIAPL